MRYLAWLLLLANLGMLVWLLTQPEPPPQQFRAIPLPPGIEPLVLLSERAPRAATPERRSEPADAVSSANPSATNPPAPSSPATPTAEPSPPAPAPTTCHAIGPFTEQADARSADAQLESGGYRTHSRVGEVRQPSGYWVYMPGMPAAQARRIVAELDANGMSDYFIGNQSYISLGIFSDKSKAQTRLEQIRQLGFDAVLDQRYRTRKVYWIDIDPAAQPLLVSAVWTQLQQRYPDIRVQRVSCD